MKKIQKITTQLTIKKLNSKALQHLKGGKNGKDKEKSHNGCPPPDAN